MLTPGITRCYCEEKREKILIIIAFLQRGMPELRTLDIHYIRLSFFTFQLFFEPEIINPTPSTRFEFNNG